MAPSHLICRVLNTQLLVATVHSRVLELEYGAGDLPTKVTVDEVIP